VLHLKRAREFGLFLVSLVFLALPTVPVLQAAPAGRNASWTFMVYLDADNNLDEYAPYSLGMMEEVGSTSSVNVVVLWDGFYTPAYMYKVIKDGLEEVKGFALNGEEVNMGDPATLKTFVDFTVSKFKAEHYVLVLWNHGDDVSGVAWDEHPDDHLTHPEVATALSRHHIDILAFDACLMAMIEVAYEYDQYGLSSDYLVGSENYVPNYGYPYNTILQDLNLNPGMSEFDVSAMIVHDYAEFYEPRAHFHGGVMGTLSAIDLARVDGLVFDLSVMTQALMKDMVANHGMISEARGDGMLPWSEYGWDLYIDLTAFVEHITFTTTDSTVKSAGLAVLSSLSQVVVALGNTEPMESAGAKGMGIWFPSSYHRTWGSILYTATKFAGQGWLDFLYAYWNDYHA